MGTRRQRFARAVSLTLAIGFCTAVAHGQRRPPRSAPARNAPARTEQSPAHFFPASRFVLPMQHPQGDPLRVELLVSRDTGRTWKVMDAIHYRDRRPTANQFTVQAPQDGRYWFTVRTLFPSHAEPAGPPRPDVFVIVDTRQPALTLRVLSGPAGEVVAQWEASDEHLSAKSLRLEYQSGQGEWQRISLEDRFEPNAKSVRGETVFWPKSNAEGVNVRAVVEDEAGNRRQAQQWHPLAKVAERSPPTDSARARASVNDLADSGGAIPWKADRATSPRPARDSNPPLAPTPESALADNSSSTPSGSAPSASANHPSPRVASNEGWSSRNPTASSVSSAVAPVHPPVSHRPNNSATPISKTLLKQLPDGDTPSMTNSKQFELDYDVDAVGRDGVARVELYRTLNAGTSWALDQRLDSPNPDEPIRVTVQQEGIYGYRVVVVARNGLSSRRPGPGDQADLWIGVDVTQPTVRLTGAVYGRNDQAGKLSIRWQAHDALFGDRPVNIRFSESPDGPWSTIASGLPNTGEYLWAADPRTPEEVYLRIEVRDAAGNVGVDQLERPVKLEGLIPRGRIRGFRPVGR